MMNDEGRMKNVPALRPPHPAYGHLLPNAEKAKNDRKMTGHFCDERLC
jgi:hypothetical protein